MKTLLSFLLLVYCSALAADQGLQWQYEELNSIVVDNETFIDFYQNPESLILAAAMQAMLSTDYPSSQTQDEGRAGATTRTAGTAMDNARKTDPSSIVNSIYRDNIIVWPDADHRSSLLSERLSASFANSQRTSGLSSVLTFDPTINGKKARVEGLVVHPAVYDGNHAFVNVRFRTFDQDNALVYSFIREGNDWKLDELASISGETRWLLTKLLQKRGGTPD